MQLPCLIKLDVDEMKCTAVMSPSSMVINSPQPQRPLTPKPWHQSLTTRGIKIRCYDENSVSGDSGAMAVPFAESPASFLHGHRGRGNHRFGR